VIGLPVTTELAVQLVRPGGTAYLVGLHRPGQTFPSPVLT
jgi:S-(hydroxymethyl)glutathione dehydrogenase/alcohol dehydrogenase